MKKFIGKYPYNNYYVWIAKSKKTNRKHCTLMNIDTGKTTSTSYARYLLAVKLGRFLTDKETADHINEDRTDDRIENLQILSRSENYKKYAKKRLSRKWVSLKCPQCGKVFDRKHSNTFIAKGGTYTSCCRRCNRLIVARIQNGENIDFSNNVVKEYRKRAYTSTG